MSDNEVLELKGKKGTKNGTTYEGDEWSQLRGNRAYTCIPRRKPIQKALTDVVLTAYHCAKERASQY
jgi:hypothetical protein